MNVKSMSVRNKCDQEVTLPCYDVCEKSLLVDNSVTLNLKSPNENHRLRDV